MPLFQGNAIPSATGYAIENSCRFNRGDPAYMSQTFSSAGNRRTWTFSAWIKIGNLLLASGNSLGIFGAYGSGHTANIQIDGNGEFHWEHHDGSSYAGGLRVTTAKHRDPTNWYHVMIAYDTTQGTASNRIKLYVNGTHQTDLVSGTHHGWPAQNYEGRINTASEHIVGKVNNAYHWDGYMAEINFIDGTALTPSSFGEVDEDYGHWKPIKPSGLTYGTNGFHLDFKNASSLGNDANGSNNWTTSNLATHDQMLDSPTNNFCVINHLDAPVSTHDIFKEGNLRYENNVNADASMKRATFAMESGKWYWEVLKLAGTDTGTTMGIMPAPAGNKVNNYIGAAAGASNMNTGGGIGFYQGGQGVLGDGGTVHGSAFSQAVGSILMFAYDADTGKMWVGLNGTWRDSGNPSTLASPWATFSDTSPKSPAFQAHNGCQYIANFGQDSTFVGETTAGGNSDTNGRGNFKYTVPTNFKSLCLLNLPTSTVVPQDYFNTVLYTGNGSGQSITGVGFQPDWIWIKARNTSSYNPEVYDSARGVHKSLATASSGAEYSSSTTVTAFNSDGWTMGNNHAGINNNGTTFVAWNWKAGGSPSSNTDGSVTANLSANPTAGFSVSTFTSSGSGTFTVGHGLSAVPKMIIYRPRGASAWQVGHHSLGWTYFLKLDATTAASSNTAFGNTTPTTSVWTGNTANVGTNEACFAYVFAEIEGYSKIGQYLANDSTDGTMIYTGFRPSFIIVKRTDSSGTGWIMMDNARDTYNVMNNSLRGDAAEAENTTRSTMPCDFLSNGFKWRINYSDVNGSTGGTFHNYVYYAVAEYPFKHSNAR